jgi:hypothetical protein
MVRVLAIWHIANTLLAVRASLSNNKLNLKHETK